MTLRHRSRLTPLALCWLAQSVFAVPVAVDDPASGNLPALAPPRPELPPTFWEQHGLWMVASGIGLILILAFACWKYSRTRPANVVPPEAVARAALAERLPLPETGSVLRDISRILRRYVQTAFALPAGEVTTSEFIHATTANDLIGAELAGQLAVFLRECDQRKFAPSAGTAPLQAATRALALVSLAETRRRPADHPASPPP
jgi:hypothetical protein